MRLQGREIVAIAENTDNNCYFIVLNQTKKSELIFNSNLRAIDIQ